MFRDRIHAGEQLAQSVMAEFTQLKTRGVNSQPIIYALPRGGIPVAVPVAHSLGCPVDILVAKKITFPENPELAIGAVTVRWTRAMVSAKASQKPAECAGSGVAASSR
jgi:predicted phosphoribosyltransferase